MAKRTGLGRGLGAIFGEDVVENSEGENRSVSRETSPDYTVEEKKEEPGKEYMMKLSIMSRIKDSQEKILTKNLLGSWQTLLKDMECCSLFW